ncbi:MAG: hypothetical protein WDM87_05615 [Terracidiphilus sp.]
MLNGASDVSSIAPSFTTIRQNSSSSTSPLEAFSAVTVRPPPPSTPDQPAGNLVVGMSRPSGTHGITGTGVVCVLTFQAKKPPAPATSPSLAPP